jgi:hypothetical protein
MEEEKQSEKTLKEEIRELKDVISGEKQKKIKKFKIPYKAKLNKSNLKKGFVTVAVIENNKAIDFIKEPIIDGTIKLKDTYHAVEDYSIYSYNGKPFIFQAKSKLNPYDPLDGPHETYGQKYIMARMEGDKITAKKSLGWGLGIGLLVIVGIVIYFVLTGK